MSEPEAIKQLKEEIKNVEWQLGQATESVRDHTLYARQADERATLLRARLAGMRDQMTIAQRVAGEMTPGSRIDSPTAVRMWREDDLKEAIERNNGQIKDITQMVNSLTGSLGQDEAGPAVAKPRGRPPGRKRKPAGSAPSLTKNGKRRGRPPGSGRKGKVDAGEVAAEANQRPPVQAREAVAGVDGDFHPNARLIAATGG